MARHFWRIYALHPDANVITIEGVTVDNANRAANEIRSAKSDIPRCTYQEKAASNSDDHACRCERKPGAVGFAAHLLSIAAAAALNFDDLTHARTIRRKVVLHKLELRSLCSALPNRSAFVLSR